MDDAASRRSRESDSDSHDDNLNLLILRRLIKQSGEALSKNKCYSQNIRDELFEFVNRVDNFGKDVLEKIENYLRSLKKGASAEKFFATFYPTICRQAAEIFPMLSPRTSTLVCPKLAVKLIVYFKEDLQNSGQVLLDRLSKPLSDKEIAGLEYLEVYVSSKLCRTYIKQAIRSHQKMNNQ